LGTALWMERNGVSCRADIIRFASECESRAESVLFLSVAGGCVGAISLADKPRPGATSLLRRLHQQGMRLSLLTGDRRKVAESIVADLGEEMEVIAEVLPDEKAAVMACTGNHCGRSALRSNARLRASDQPTAQALGLEQGD